MRISAAKRIGNTFSGVGSSLKAPSCFILRILFTLWELLKRWYGSKTRHWSSFLHNKNIAYNTESVLSSFFYRRKLGRIRGLLQRRRLHCWLRFCIALYDVLATGIICWSLLGKAIRRLKTVYRQKMTNVRPRDDAFKTAWWHCR